jgi:hypothetical protein
VILGIDAGATFAGFTLQDDAGRVRSHKLRTSARDLEAVILRMPFFGLGGILRCCLVCVSRRICQSRHPVPEWVLVPSAAWVHQQVYLHGIPRS